jgi:hypothetical protein
MSMNGILFSVLCRLLSCERARKKMGGRARMTPKIAMMASAVSGIWNEINFNLGDVFGSPW